MPDSIDAVWALLQKHQQEVFHTAKGLPFTYTQSGAGSCLWIGGRSLSRSLP